MSTRLIRHPIIAVLLIALSLSTSCAHLHRSGAADTQTAGRPPCADPEVLAQLVEMAATHPNHSPGIPSTALSIGEVEETRAQEIPDIAAGTFRRLCIGQMTLQSGEVLPIGWEIFTTDTMLGPVYGITPCFGKYDMTGRDCTALSRGELPGELLSTQASDP